MASTSTEESRRVASRAAGESQRVAARAKDQGQVVARTAKDQGAAVARTASESASELATTVRQQTAQVRHEIAVQGRTVVDETRTKIEEQTQAQARRAAQGLSRLASEARALADGRPEEAETIRDYMAQGADRLMEAADRIYGLADEVETRGIDGLVHDVQHFARRRPAAFLLGAAVMGFGVGRAFRSVQSDSDDDETWRDRGRDGGAGHETSATGARRRTPAVGPTPRPVGGRRPGVLASSGGPR